MKVDRIFIKEDMTATGIQITNEDLEPHEVGIIVVSGGEAHSWTLTKREIRELLDALKEYTGDIPPTMPLGAILSPVDAF